jgi:hypothetical protein
MSRLSVTSIRTWCIHGGGWYGKTEFAGRLRPAIAICLRIAGAIDAEDKVNVPLDRGGVSASGRYEGLDFREGQSAADALNVAKYYCIQVVTLDYKVKLLSNTVKYCFGGVQ